MGVGKVPGETEGSHKTSKLEGNHDNPVRGIHQAPSHWEPSGEMSRYLSKNIQREGKAGSQIG